MLQLHQIAPELVRAKDPIAKHCCWGEKHRVITVVNQQQKMIQRRDLDRIFSSEKSTEHRSAFQISLGSGDLDQGTKGLDVGLNAQLPHFGEAGSWASLHRLVPKSNRGQIHVSKKTCGLWSQASHLSVSFHFGSPGP